MIEIAEKMVNWSVYIRRNLPVAH